MEHSNQSKVWEHFAQDGNQASCRLCAKKYAAMADQLVVFPAT